MKHRPEEYDWILIQFNKKGIVPVIVAGQAVNIWSNIHRDWDTEHNPHYPKIKDLVPLNSEDMELLDTGLTEVLEKLSGVSGVEKTEPFQHAHSPDIATVYLEQNKGDLFKIQVMVSVLGATKEEILRKAITLKAGSDENATEVKVIDPITLLKCKIENLLTLDQEKPTLRHDKRHIQLLICCIRAFIEKTATNKDDPFATRHALNIIKATKNILKSKKAATLADRHGINWQNCLPTELFHQLARTNETWDTYLSKQKSSQ